MLSPFLKGDINITFDINRVYNLLSINNHINKIINLDEDTKLNHPDVVVGSCLLPPPECMMAEVDGNESLYDSIYGEYSSTPYIAKWYNTLMASVYIGNRIIIYHPPVDASESKMMIKFLSMFRNITGVEVGCLDYREPSKTITTPLYFTHWSDIFFSMDVMDVYEFLKWRSAPDNMNITNEMPLELYFKVASILGIVADDDMSMMKFVNELITESKQRPIALAIHKIRR